MKTNQFKNHLTILYECPHENGKKKHRHHPNYKKWWEVEILCTSCHAKRREGQQNIELERNSYFKRCQTDSDCIPDLNLQVCRKCDYQPSLSKMIEMLKIC